MPILPLPNRRLVVSCVSILCAVFSVWSVPAAAGPWTVEDIVTAESFGSMALSPDGRRAAWTVSQVDTVDGEETRISKIYLADLSEIWNGSSAENAADNDSDDGDSPAVEARALTHGGERIGTIAFSPDGAHLAFTSSRDVPGAETSGQQLWVLPMAGGEARPVTRWETLVAAFDWIDSESLLVAREESPSGLLRKREDGDDTATAIDDTAEASPVRLWTVPLDGSARRLTTNDDWIDELDVAPDGRRAVIVAQRSLSFEYDSKVPPKVWIVDLATGERTEMDLAGSLLPYGPRWSAEGDAVYFLDGHSSHPFYRTAFVLRLGRWDAATGRSEILDIDWPRGLGGELRSVPGGVLANLADGVYAKPSLLGAKDGVGTREDLAGDDVRFFQDVVPSADGKTLLVRLSAGDRPNQLYAARLDSTRVASFHRLSDLNPGFADKTMPKVEVLRYEGALGEEVEALLHHPVDPPDGPAPLVLSPHGGPAGHDAHAWDSRWSYPNLLWQQRGAYVLEVNYHGSDAYGLDWVESIAGRYYELEIPDLEKGVDLLIERGLVDPERMAVAGWSNGGILAAKLITVTDRYRAAIIGAADVEWVSDWANVDFGASFDNYYFGGPPWERLDHYLEKSPFFQLPEVTTPSLVHTGSEDRSVPTHQSWSIFRVLQQVGRADVRFLVYPGEGHGLSKIAHRRRKVEEDVAWLERHLFATWSEPTWAIPEDSTLDALLAQAAAHRAADGRLGALRDGTLVPEIVALPTHLAGDATEEIEAVGRFEVTRDQWAAFDETFEVGAHGGDLPVTGISFEDAGRYVAWLADLTGEALRLPTKSEAEALAGDGGNVLDEWIGHAPNPDDAASIRAHLEERGLSLLRAVGSGAPTRDERGAPALFDLDGNAAEWATSDDDSDDDAGVAVGPSADRSSDEDTEPGAGYVGLRVVRGRS